MTRGLIILVSLDSIGLLYLSQRLFAVCCHDRRRRGHPVRPDFPGPGDLVDGQRGGVGPALAHGRARSLLPGEAPRARQTGAHCNADGSRVVIRYGTAAARFAAICSRVILPSMYACTCSSTGARNCGHARSNRPTEYRYGLYLMPSFAGCWRVTSPATWKSTTCHRSFACLFAVLSAVFTAAETF